MIAFHENIQTLLLNLFVSQKSFNVLNIFFFKSCNNKISSQYLRIKKFGEFIKVKEKLPFAIGKKSNEKGNETKTFFLWCEFLNSFNIVQNAPYSQYSKRKV